ncbi:conserved hypothetical protein [Sphingomonas aurantiaca]|jgi:hypothetical protein|uniref:DUF6894 domain-containing protein n=1 Tax=Sphingomonas aurantiaca TaxID=185949 RepID=A0A5E8A6A5_9SPHN|nr:MULTISPECIES: hypothetical protein [Sphingomonas]KQN10708.1 hypothetical protein ASE79_11335 [Sphingomonas sp. Leaf28]VVT26498.1 conserved hypothetical protein [Sphingomonas aurantiaca]
MPRYFFDIDNHKHAPDEDGTDLPDDENARVQAVIFAGDYLSDHPDIVRHGACFRVAVRDDQGSVLLAVDVTITEPGADTGLPPV